MCEIGKQPQNVAGGNPKFLNECLEKTWCGGKNLERRFPHKQLSEHTANAIRDSTEDLREKPEREKSQRSESLL